MRCRATCDAPPDRHLESEVLRFSGFSPAMGAAFAGRPLVLSRAVVTPNREMTRFLRLARIVGRAPLVATIPQDRFTPAVNPAKRRLAKLPVATRYGGIRFANIVSFGEMDGRRFNDMRCIDGTPFLDLHDELMQNAIDPQFRPASLDLAGFWGDAGSREYYPRFLALFTCFGVLAEGFPSFGYERAFTDDVILPAFDQVIARFGKAPRIVRLLPPGEELEPSWEYYPGSVMERALLATRRPPVNETPAR